MRFGEGILFFSLAAGIHAGLWHLAPIATGASASGGTGVDTMTLAAATPSQTAMVEAWQQAPEATSASPTAFSEHATSTPAEKMNHPPVLQGERPALKAPPLPPQHVGQSLPSKPPQIDTTSAAPPRSKVIPAKVRPKIRPLKPAAQQKTSATSAAQAERQAAGQAKQAQRGSGGNDLTQSKDVHQSSVLRAQWGALIHAKVQRNLRYPRDASGSGTAKLALKVAPDGKLQGLTLLRSSGNPKLDKAAAQAVQRAGRFAKAPLQLTKAQYAFSLSLTFNR